MTSDLLEENQDLKKQIAELKKENAELKRDKEDLIFIRNQNAKCMCEDKEQLTKAKELLREMIDTPVFYQMGGEAYENELYIELVAEAEQFLNSEVEK